MHTPHGSAATLANGEAAKKSMVRMVKKEQQAKQQIATTNLEIMNSYL
jgi:hypothetical protein